MKIIFLDIDGVLNYEEYYKRGRVDKPYPLSEICPQAISNLNRICNDTGAKIVVSSSWRGDGINYCSNILKECGFEGDVIDITGNESYYHEWAERGNEILKWLKDKKLYKYDSYKVTDHDYVIIDDDNDMLYQQRHNFFECSPNTGLTEKMAEDIISFLNTKPLDVVLEQSVAV